MSRQIIGERIGTVRLTYLMMVRLRSACSRALRASQRQHEADKAKGWKPDPGRGDANLARVAVMQDIINQLDPQIEAAKRNHHAEAIQHAQCQGD